MSAIALSPDVWALSDQSDRRFKRLLLALALPALIAGIVIPFVQLAQEVLGGGEMVPRYAKLLPQAPVTPTPEEPKEQPRTESKPKPQLTQEQKVQQARQKASKSMMAVSDLLAEMRETTVAAAPGTLQREAVSSTKSSSALASSAAAASQGIGETRVAERSESSTGLSSRRTTAVDSPVGAGTLKDKSGSAGGKWVSGRTVEELNLVFDRNKGALYTLYNRALRQNPRLDGMHKLILRITIAPSGEVIKISVVSSDLGDKELENKLASRVQLFNFGPKDVGAFTVDYPLIILPARGG